MLIPFCIRYVKGHAPSSMNVLASQLSSYANILKKLNRKYHVVVAKEGEGGPEVMSIEDACGLNDMLTLSLSLL